MSGISSGFGAWNPVAWTLLFLGILAVAFVVRATGRAGYKRGSGQTKAFLSGNEEPEARNELHVRGANLYWGMIDGLSAYYRRIRAMHTGVFNDYAAWVVVVLAIVFVVLVWVG